MTLPRSLLASLAEKMSFIKKIRGMVAIDVDNLQYALSFSFSQISLSILGIKAMLLQRIHFSRDLKVHVRNFCRATIGLKKKIKDCTFWFILTKLCTFFFFLLGIIFRDFQDSFMCILRLYALTKHIRMYKILSASYLFRYSFSILAFKNISGKIPPLKIMITTYLFKLHTFCHTKIV